MRSVILFPFIAGIVACVLSVSVSAGELPATVPGILDRLDEVLDRRNDFRTERADRADSLKRLLAAGGDRQRLRYCEEAGNVYCGFNMDSAAYYYTQGMAIARSLGDSVAYQRLNLERIAILPLQGAVKDAVDEFGQWSNGDIYPENRIAYLEAGNRMYFYAGSFYSGDEMQTHYFEKGAVLCKELVRELPAESPRGRLLQAQLHYANKDYPMAVAYLKDVLDETAVSDNVYAQAACMLATYYEERGKTDEAIYYYAASAISDAMSATLEEVSLQRLGVVLYNAGNVSKAYEYLSMSLDNAVSSGSRMRTLEASQSLPIITQAFREQDSRRFSWMMVLIAGLVVALVVIVGITVSLRRGIGKRDRLKQRLVETNRVKETYIGEFLNLSSIYLEKLEEFNKVAGRKIAAGQIEELYGLIKSGRMLEEQGRQFYDVFDNAFIHIYPTFVDDVNALFREDRRMTMPDKSRLNTEFRILAFIRLGMDDSPQIARFLGLSLNTVYTYRNKLKGRAVNRDTFERDIMSIGNIS